MVYIYSQIQYYLFQDLHRLKLNADAVYLVLTPVAMNAAHRFFPVSELFWSHRDLLSWQESWDLVNYCDLVNVSSLESDNTKLHFSLWKSDETTVPFISDTCYLKQRKHFPTTDPQTKGVFHIKKQLITDFFVTFSLLPLSPSLAFFKALGMCHNICAQNSPFSW